MSTSDILLVTSRPKCIVFDAVVHRREEDLPSCCSVAAFTCAGRFSVCSKLSYASFAALNFFCRMTRGKESDREGGGGRERAIEGLI